MAFCSLVTFAICYGIADISWRFFESKFLRLKSKFEVRPAKFPLDAVPDSHSSDAALPAETPHEVGIV